MIFFFFFLFFVSFEAFELERSFARISVAHMGLNVPREEAGDFLTRVTEFDSPGVRERTRTVNVRVFLIETTRREEERREFRSNFNRGEITRCGNWIFF